MSDMMGPPPGGAPNNAMENSRSMFNPVDLAVEMKRGTMGPNMTIRDLITGVFKLKLDDPVSALVSAMKSQAQNATMSGKMQSLGGQPPPGPSAPPPSGPPAPPPSGGGLAGLAQNLNQ